MAALADHLFEDMDADRRAVACRIFSQARVTKAAHLAAAFGEPQDVLKRLGRPLPSFIFDRLCEKKLICRYSPEGDAHFGAKYLYEKEDEQSRCTGSIIEYHFADVVTGLSAQQLLPLARILAEPLDFFEYPTAYLQVVKGVEEMLGTKCAYDELVVDANESVNFLFKYGGKLGWVLACCRGEDTEAFTVGGVMYTMHRLFGDEPDRKFGFSAVMMMDYIWVFEFTPQSYQPVLCLYQLFREGGLETLAKLMCASSARLGLGGAA